MTSCGDKHRMLARLADGSGADAPTASKPCRCRLMGGEARQVMSDHCQDPVRAP